MREGGAGTKTYLEHFFSEWCSPIPELIAATKGTDIVTRAERRREPSRRWGRGRVALLGDAAHPMTPDLGQGGCMAIEDALVLADRIARAPTDIVSALRSYERARQRRMASIVRRSAMAGRVFCARRGIPSALRDLAMKSTPQWLVRLGASGIVGYQVPVG